MENVRAATLAIELLPDIDATTPVIGLPRDSNLEDRKNFSRNAWQHVTSPFDMIWSNFMCFVQQQQRLTMQTKKLRCNRRKGIRIKWNHHQYYVYYTFYYSLMTQREKEKERLPTKKNVFVSQWNVLDIYSQLPMKHTVMKLYELQDHTNDWALKWLQCIPNLLYFFKYWLQCYLFFIIIFFSEEQQERREPFLFRACIFG